MNDFTTIPKREPKALPPITPGATEVVGAAVREYSPVSARNLGGMKRLWQTASEPHNDFNWRARVPKDKEQFADMYWAANNDQDINDISLAIDASLHDQYVMQQRPVLSQFAAIGAGTIADPINLLLAFGGAGILNQAIKSSKMLKNASLSSRLTKNAIMGAAAAIPSELALQAGSTTMTAFDSSVAVVASAALGSLFGIKKERGRLDIMKAEVVGFDPLEKVKWKTKPEEMTAFIDSIDLDEVIKQELKKKWDVSKAAVVEGRQGFKTTPDEMIEFLDGVDIDDMLRKELKGTRTVGVDLDELNTDELAGLLEHKNIVEQIDIEPYLEPKTRRDRHDLAKTGDDFIRAAKSTAEGGPQERLLMAARRHIYGTYPGYASPMVKSVAKTFMRLLASADKKDLGKVAQKIVDTYRSLDVLTSNSLPSMPESPIRFKIEDVQQNMKNLAGLRVIDKDVLVPEDAAVLSRFWGAGKSTPLGVSIKNINELRSLNQQIVKEHKVLDRSIMEGLHVEDTIKKIDDLEQQMTSTIENTDIRPKSEIEVENSLGMKWKVDADSFEGPDFLRETEIEEVPFVEDVPEITNFFGHTVHESVDVEESFGAVQMPDGRIVISNTDDAVQIRQDLEQIGEDVSDVKTGMIKDGEFVAPKVSTEIREVDEFLEAYYDSAIEKPKDVAIDEGRMIKLASIEEIEPEVELELKSKPVDPVMREIEDIVNDIPLDEVSSNEVDTYVIREMQSTHPTMTEGSILTKLEAIYDSPGLPVESIPTVENMSIYTPLEDTLMIAASKAGIDIDALVKGTKMINSAIAPGFEKNFSRDLRLSKEGKAIFKQHLKGAQEGQGRGTFMESVRSRFPELIGRPINKSLWERIVKQNGFEEQIVKEKIRRKAAPTKTQRVPKEVAKALKENVSPARRAARKIDAEISSFSTLIGKVTIKTKTKKSIAARAALDKRIAGMSADDPLLSTFRDDLKRFYPEVQKVLEGTSEEDLIDFVEGMSIHDKRFVIFEEDFRNALPNMDFSFIKEPRKD